MKFEFQLANKIHISQIMELMKSAKTSMEHQDWFVDDEEDFLHYILEGNGFILLAKPAASNQLAGFFIIKFPGLAEDNLGRHLHFTEQELMKCAHMDSCVVDIKFRGHHLQSQMAAMAEEMLSNTQYTYLLATVHPDNCYSMNSMMRCGYRVVKETYLYGGLRRAILFKQISID